MLSLHLGNIFICRVQPIFTDEEKSCMKHQKCDKMAVLKPISLK